MKTSLAFAAIVAFLLACSGCANGTGGQVVGGILTGIGAGLSGL